MNTISKINRLIASAAYRARTLNQRDGYNLHLRPDARMITTAITPATALPHERPTATASVARRPNCTSCTCTKQQTARSLRHLWFHKGHDVAVTHSQSCWLRNGGHRLFYLFIISRYTTLSMLTSGFALCMSSLESSQSIAAG